jgi:hypothetical protein
MTFPCLTQHDRLRRFRIGQVRRPHRIPSTADRTAGRDAFWPGIPRSSVACRPRPTNTDLGGRTVTPSRTPTVRAATVMPPPCSSARRTSRNSRRKCRCSPTPKRWPRSAKPTKPTPRGTWCMASMRPDAWGGEGRRGIRTTTEEPIPLEERKASTTAVGVGGPASKGELTCLPFWKRLSAQRQQALIPPSRPV